MDLARSPSCKTGSAAGGKYEVSLWAHTMGQQDKGGLTFVPLSVVYRSATNIQIVLALNKMRVFIGALVLAVS